MGAIDYSALFQQTPQSGLSRGLSGLTSVLDAIMERDARQKQHDAQLKQARELAAIDDARLQQQADEVARYHQSEMDQRRAELDAKGAEQQAARAEKATPNILDALANRNPTAAHIWAQNAGGSVTEAPRTTVPENAVGDMLASKPPADQGPDLSSLPGPFNILGAVQQQRKLAQAAYANDPLNAPAVPQEQAAPQVPQGPLKYRVSMPGQAPVDYDQEEERRARIQQGGQLATDVGGMAGPGPYDRRAQADVERMAKTGAFKTRDEVVQAFYKQKNFYEQQANELERARISAAAQGGRTDKAHPQGELDFLDEAGKVIGKTRSPEEGRKFREGRDALVGISQAIGPLKEHLLAHGRTDIAGMPIDSAEVVGQRDAMISNVTDYLTTLKNTGVLNGGEYDRYVKLLGTSVTRGGKAAAAVLDEIERGARTHYYSHSGSARAQAPTSPTASMPAAKPAARSLVDEFLGDQ